MAASGKVASSVLVSCRHTASGCVLPSQSSRCGSRTLSELTFQVASFTRLLGYARCVRSCGRGFLSRLRRFGLPGLALLRGFVPLGRLGCSLVASREGAGARIARRIEQRVERALLESLLHAAADEQDRHLVAPGDLDELLDAVFVPRLDFAER